LHNCDAVIIVGTHLDDPQFENNMELVQQRLELMDTNFGRRFTNIKGITAVSATTGAGITELADMIKEIAMYESGHTHSLTHSH
jgi:coenzyme F420-reducing hydrogenase delta subunit